MKKVLVSTAIELALLTAPLTQTDLTSSPTQLNLDEELRAACSPSSFTFDRDE